MRAPTSLFAQRDARLFLAAQALDAVAIGVAGVALPWLVLDQGASAGVAGLVYPLTIVPYVVFGILAGGVGDRVAWRRVISTSTLVQALASASIPLWAITGDPPLALVFTAAFVVGSGRVFADAAAFGAVASVVGPEDFVRGQSALSAVWSVGFLAGPAIGGVLIALVGPAYAIAAEAGALLLASLLVALVRSGRTAPAGATEPRRDLRAGARFIRENRAVRAFTFVNLAAGFVTAGAFGLQVPLLREVVGLSPTATGWVLAADALAATGAALATPRLTQRFGAAPVCVSALAVEAAAIAALAAGTSPWSAAPAIVAYAALASMLSVVFISERQRRAPAALQARVGIAGRMLMLGAIAAGSTVATALTGAAGLRGIYVAMGAGTALVSAIGGPLLLRFERLHTPDPGTPGEEGPTIRGGHDVAQTENEQDVDLAQKSKDEQEAAREEMKQLEDADEVPSDPREWPDGKAKFLTFDVESDEPYGEGATAKLGPGSVEHHEDGSVSVNGEKVDNPEDFKGEPIPGGPTDPNAPKLKGETD